MHIIIGFAFGHLAVSHLIKKYFVDLRKDEGPNTFLLTLHLAFGIAYLVYIFEAGLIFWLIIVIINYICAKLFGSYSFYEPFL